MTKADNEEINIDYDSTKEFFENRAQKYTEDYPYVTTMYQDNNPELTKIRDEYEKNMIYHMLKIQSDSKILDIGCGVGRWTELVYKNVLNYLGIDFSDKLLEIARTRVKTIPGKIEFQQLAAQDIENNEKLIIKGKFNRFILSGVLLYLNDKDLERCFNGIISLSEFNSIIYIREPLAKKNRLTLKKHYSDELRTKYSAIYRTKKQYKQKIENFFIKNKFKIVKEGFLYPEPLNNRKETTQYYFILERVS